MLGTTGVDYYIRQCWRSRNKRRNLIVGPFLEIMPRRKGLKSIRVQIRFADNRMTARSIGKLRQLQKLQKLNEPFISKMAKIER